MSGFPSFSTVSLNNFFLPSSVETGACIYFTFIIKSGNSMRDLKAVRDAIMDNFIKNGAAISDHHGTGTYFRKYQDPGKLKMQSMLEYGMFSGWQNES